jgi:hypothetical protein
MLIFIFMERKVVAGGSTSACEELFYLHPKIQYNLAACKKVIFPNTRQLDQNNKDTCPLLLLVTKLIRLFIIHYTCLICIAHAEPQVVVSLDMKQEGWASLTIDFRRCITYLIHPNLSAVCPVDVLHHHIDLMKILTQAAQEHMTKHGGAVIPMVEWEYEVALKTEHHMNG